MSAEVVVRGGNPTPEELAAVIAVLCARPAGVASLTGYEAWRSQRLAALRRQRAH